jgi:acyl carrier protein
MTERQTVIQLLSEAIEVDAAEVLEESELRSFDTFDSIGVLTLIGLLEDNTGFVLDPNAIPKLVRVSDLCDLVCGAP